MQSANQGSVSLVVYGDPQPAGSKRAFLPRGKDYPVVVDANPKAAGWKDHIAKECAQQYGGVLLDGALAMELHFYQPRPKGHYGARGLLPSAPSHPTVRPDIDKLSRAVLDGLTGQLYRNDAQVVEKHAFKHYGEPARVKITVRSIGADDAQLELVSTTPLSCGHGDSDTAEDPTA